ncbi:hypothetical protein Hypma_014393 [Hypsizygus marmoreus]|uniref:BLOC-1-related complex subunit 7 n=1 Tax=Hypsizygus marmoreus TaxID=39966 RepID=A0A369JCD7_HYPMA|nr:hypothetical protein Hypma_014393 [Hypsizygus marmoreus]
MGSVREQIMERPVSIEDQNEISALAKSSIAVASDSLHTAIQQLIRDSEHSITSIDLEIAHLPRQQESQTIRIQQYIPQVYRVVGSTMESSTSAMVIRSCVL